MNSKSCRTQDADEFQDLLFILMSKEIGDHIKEWTWNGLILMDALYVEMHKSCLGLVLLWS
ncbi:Uncharacterized protein DAT39_005749 [Clarias magur]|uniref:Uncharacterized protein n=1 Tax=Clarias magur TaxID=1594786 RepID=A0A8J4UDY2_CLAMG|nr:Uncharacterized protein DAT39_005749 [Clarias magur]